MQIIRGQIWFAYLDPVFGRELGGYKPRPVVVISINDIHKQEWGVVTVVSGTSNIGPRGNHLVLVRQTTENGLNQDTNFQCHQLRALDKARLFDYRGKITEDDLTKLGEAVKKTLGLVG